MSPNVRPPSLRQVISTSDTRSKALMQQGDYASAEVVFKECIKSIKSASSLRNEDAQLILNFGKCLEAQHKYEDAYELYMSSLSVLSGAAYDDVYISFLYLNERMGTFVKKESL